VTIPIPTSEKNFLNPEQTKLKNIKHISRTFLILFLTTFHDYNLPIGRNGHLEHIESYMSYRHFRVELQFPSQFNVSRMNFRLTIWVMYMIATLTKWKKSKPAKTRDGEKLTVAKLLLEAGALDLIEEIQTAPYCYGCNSCGSSCGGAYLKRTDS